MLAAKTSRNGSKLTKYARQQTVDLGLSLGVWARLLSLYCACIISYHTIPYHLAVARIILPGIHKYAAVPYAVPTARQMDELRADAAEPNDGFIQFSFLALRAGHWNSDH